MHVTIFAIFFVPVNGTRLRIEERTMDNRWCRKAKLPPLLFHRFVSATPPSIPFSVVYNTRRILVDTNLEENRVTARLTNEISIRLQNTFQPEYRRRTPGGSTFTRRFVRMIDARDRVHTHLQYLHLWLAARVNDTL